MGGVFVTPIARHERIMLQFLHIILLRIAQKFPRLFSILFFDIITDKLITWHRWNIIIGGKM